MGQNLNHLGTTADRLCLALDHFSSLIEVQERVRELAPYVGYFKIGMGAFGAWGPQVVETVLASGGKIFLDLKFFDIPHTVQEAAFHGARLGVSILNVHAGGGIPMMQAARQGALAGAQQGKKPPPKVIGVTVLTSFDQKVFQQTYQTQNSLAEQVLHLAQLARQAELDGIVCAAQDLATVYQQLPPEFFTITPGISGATTAAGADQARASSPSAAIKAGAHLLVIGRAINDLPSASERIAQAVAINQEIAPYVLV